MSSNKLICYLCKCEEYPSCIYNDEMCDNCIDGASGFHLKIAFGYGVCDVPDDYKECTNCNEYYDPDERHHCDEN